MAERPAGLETRDTANLEACATLTEGAAPAARGRLGAALGPSACLGETFDDPRFYQGTGYKVSGWSQLGRTAG